MDSIVENHWSVCTVGGEGACNEYTWKGKNVHSHLKCWVWNIFQTSEERCHIENKI